MPVRVCFYRPNAAALVSGVPVCAMGGAEVHAWELARRLAARGEYQVTLVVGDYGQPALPQREGVAIHVHREPWFRRISLAYRQYREALERLSEGRIAAPAVALAKSVPPLAIDRLLKLARRSQPKRGFDRLLSELAADVVICFGATLESADLVKACRQRGIPSALYIMGDSQLLGDLGAGSARHPGEVEAVRQIDESIATVSAVVVQTEQQGRLLHDRFTREGHLVRNPRLGTFDLPPIGPPAVLWVGRAELVHKRPDRLWEVARKCPAIPFRVVLNPDYPGVWERLRGEKPANIEQIDRVPADEIAGYYASAALLANTSASEGFPNAFLQAAALGIPVVSLEVDPDGFLSRHGCGVCCGGDIDKMASELSRLWQDAAERHAIGQRAREYVDAYHDPDLCVDQLASVFQSLTQPAARNASAADATLADAARGPF